MRELDGQVTIAPAQRSDGVEYVQIRVTDNLSTLTFAVLKLSAQDLARALMSCGNVECKIHLREMENVGKRYESEIREVFYPADPDVSTSADLGRLRDSEREWVLQHGQIEGWQIQCVTGSRSVKGGRQIRYLIYRHVCVESTPSS